jgi:hypothetical protein
MVEPVVTLLGPMARAASEEEGTILMETWQAKPLCQNKGLPQGEI